jgi:thymidylate kinase
MDSTDINDLRERAKNVLSKLDRDEYQRPLFIEFSGSPKSGKSTCIDIVAHFFRRMEFRVLAPTEGASKRTPYYLKNDLIAFNTWSACYALTHVLEGLYHADKYHIAILDRGLFDALAWFDLLSADGTMANTDCEKVQNFLIMDKWLSAIDFVFLFRADPVTSMERENADKIIEDFGRAMNPPFLGSLNAAYDRVHGKYGSVFSNFEIIDTSKSTDSTPRSTALHVVEEILKVLEGKYSH